jgi:hypothetical protein
MIHACKWLVKKCPNVLVLFAGLWIAALPVSFVFYVEDHLMASGIRPTGIDAVLYDLHSIRHGEAVAVTIFFLGIGLSLAAIFRMIRPLTYPK